MRKIIMYYSKFLIKKWSLLVLFVLVIFVGFITIAFLHQKLEQDEKNFIKTLTLMPLLTVSIIFASMVSMSLFRDTKKFKLDLMPITKGSKRYILIISKLLIALIVVLVTSIFVGLAASMAKAFSLEMFLSFFVGELILLIFIMGFSQLLAMFLHTIFVLGIPLTIFIITFPLSITNTAMIGYQFKPNEFVNSSLENFNSIYLESDPGREMRQSKGISGVISPSIVNSSSKANSAFAFPPYHFSMLFSAFNKLDYLKLPYTKIVHDSSRKEEIEKNLLSYQFNSSSEKYFILSDFPKDHPEYLVNFKYLLETAKKIISKQKDEILTMVISGLKSQRTQFLNSNFSAALIEPFARSDVMWNVNENPKLWRDMAYEMLSSPVANTFILSLFAIIQNEWNKDSKWLDKIPQFKEPTSKDSVGDIVVSQSYLESHLGRAVPIVNAWGVLGGYGGIGIALLGIWALRFRKVDLSK